MTTHEQRITSSEQFQRETIKMAQEQNLYITQQQGIISKQIKEED